jgi:TetR/AcrR family transcriptional regulator, tetracycline repressor protein
VTFLPLPDVPPRTRRLDQPTIIAAALELLDDEGLDALTMRRLATRLNVTQGALYRHVADKDNLLMLLADEISGQVPAVALTVPWQEALTDMANAYRAVLLSHRDAARLLASIPPAGPRRLQRIESTLRLLVDAGFSSRDAAWAAYHFNNLVTEFVADEVRLASAATAAGSTTSELLASGRAQLRSLPEASFPTLRRLAQEMATDDADAQFEFGLRVWLHGMDALLQSPSG